jgi:16S rRNA processing protein RimM
MFRKESDPIPIGVIVKSRGLSGEIKAHVSFENSERLGLREILIEGKAEPFAVRSYNVSGGFAYIMLEGITDRDAADALRGRTVLVPRSALRLRAGELLRGDLIGCTLRGTDGREYGKITDIASYGAADVYTVSDGARTLRFPLVKALKHSVDMGAGVMTADAAALAEVAVYED